MGRKRRNDIVINGSAAVLDENKNPETTCHHYWIIELPNGPTSRGRCKFCGQEKEFDNLGPDAWRYADISQLLTASLRDITSEGA
jgi:hypothetical protein